ncbi:MAG: helix-turn-helix transcriptional regulator [Cyanobacteria bacterium J06648_16]
MKEDFTIEGLLDSCSGIVILSAAGELVYTNKKGEAALSAMASQACSQKTLPKEICYLFGVLTENKRLFPSQNWSIQFTVFTSIQKRFDIQARWIHTEKGNELYLLLIMNDSDQQIYEVALGEAAQYGFTSRETEVWVLHRTHYTYKEIADQLAITPNTVKKHMKNILTKQRRFLDKKR